MLPRPKFIRDHVAMVFSLWLLLLNPMGILAQPEQTRKPNVVLILTDDAGYADFGFQPAGLISTPNIDGLAAGGMVFRQAYVTAPNCSPSRAGILSGRYQQRFGHEYNLVDPEPLGAVSADSMGLPLAEKLMPQYFREVGYATALIGKWHLGLTPYYHPRHRGFDLFFGTLAGGSNYFTGTARQILRNETRVPKDSLPYLTDAFGDEAVSFIRQNSAKPFFLFLSFNAPHAPLEAKPEYLAQASPQFNTTQRATYAAMLRSVDENIGKVIAALKENGILENTLIVFTNDNGGPINANASNNAPLRGNKVLMYEGGIRVPMIAWWPNHIKAGHSDQVVSTLDLLPTFLETVTGKKSIPDHVDGLSLWPYFSKGQKTIDRTLYWRQGKVGAVRSGPWKLVYFEEANRAPELYHLGQDMAESKNRYTADPEVAARLMKLYKTWASTLHAPLWTGGPTDAQVMRFYEEVRVPRD